MLKDNNSKKTYLTQSHFLMNTARLRRIRILLTQSSFPEYVPAVTSYLKSQQFFA